MAQQVGTFDANLAAAAGEDGILLAELRAAFVESLTQQLDLLQRSRCDGNWEVAARRLKGLGASFHAAELVKLADEALDGPPGEPVVLRKLAQYCEGFRSRNEG